jgi:hypothetical protein
MSSFRRYFFQPSILSRFRVVILWYCHKCALGVARSRTDFCLARQILSVVVASLLSLLENTSFCHAESTYAPCSHGHGPSNVHFSVQQSYTSTAWLILGGVCRAVYHTRCLRVMELTGKYLVHVESLLRCYAWMHSAKSHVAVSKYEVLTPNIALVLARGRTRKECCSI